MSDENQESTNITDSKGDSAYGVLVGLALQCRGAAKGLPAQVNIKPHWSGIGFELLGRRYVAPMGEVSEMLEVPVYTRLPGVQPWVKGVSNVRGRLMPVCDLAAFLGDRLQTPKKQQRILILETEDLYTGLLVDQVFGMQHFPEDSYSSLLSYEDKSAAPYSCGCYNHEGVEWTVFSPARLTSDSHFMNAAQN